uniref:Glycine-rich protein GRP33 n=1 Tax=Artemia salina TaxID=85549 RepID=GRP33_ARTSA|nr:RecName: Full=Glycine-rich protein GRP33 [Artemia salina]AAC83400.1 glycine-rich protein [Artemia salina]
MAAKPEQEPVYVRDLVKDYDDARQMLTQAGVSEAVLGTIDAEIKHIKTGSRPKTVPNTDGSGFMDLYNDTKVKLVSRCCLPVDQFPKYNFLGKLLGPGGSTMKQLQDETMTKISILGRGSMRDRNKEEELRNSGDVKYAHLNEQLHIEIISIASPAEAHARMAYALTEIKKYITPEEDPNYMMMAGHGAGPMMGMGGMMGGPGPMGPQGRGRGRGRGGFSGPDRTFDLLEKARMNTSETMDPGYGFDESYCGMGGGYEMPYNGNAGWTASPGRGAGAGARGARGGLDQSRGGGKFPSARGGRGRAAPY